MKKSTDRSPKRKSSKKKRKSSSAKSPLKIQVPSFAAVQESPFLSTAYRMGLVQIKDEMTADERRRRRKRSSESRKGALPQNSDSIQPEISPLMPLDLNQVHDGSAIVVDRAPTPPSPAAAPLPFDQISLGNHPCMASAMLARRTAASNVPPTTGAIVTSSSTNDRSYVANLPTYSSRSTRNHAIPGPQSRQRRVPVSQRPFSADDPFGFVMDNRMKENAPSGPTKTEQNEAGATDAARRFLVDHGLAEDGEEEQESKELDDAFQLLRFEIRDHQLRRLQPRLCAFSQA